MKKSKNQNKGFFYKHYLLVALVLSIVFFALLYHLADIYTDEDQFSAGKRSKGFLSKLYFSLNTQATVGYGNIYPITTFSKTLVAIQVSITLLLVYYLGMYIIESGIEIEEILEHESDSFSR
uniref:Inward rectifier potassium channel n=1 Tax=Marseillevirus LCMAC101 TaxID=2506602 RepID=A0A481YTS7_9VIRU|nr:MAG: inward rectifier potassium channel [Marseillevirus LCMAC101]